MDKYIKILLIKLSPRFKVTINTTTYYDDENQKFSNIIHLKITRRFDGHVHKSRLYGKQELIGELMKWAEESR